MGVALGLLGGGLIIGGFALMIFLWALRSGQYEDLDGSANRILFDDDRADPKP